MKQGVLCCIVFVSLSAMQPAYAQAPGGVATGLSLWLDANTGTSVSGTQLTGWLDRKAINTFTVSATPPGFHANAVNFYPTVTFANTDTVTNLPTAYLSGNTMIGYADAYAVFSCSVSGSSGALLGGADPGIIYGRAVFANENGGMYSGNGSFGAYSFIDFTNSIDYHIFNLDQSPAAPVYMTGRLNGADKPVTSNLDFTSFTFRPMIGGTNNLGTNPDAGWKHFQGEVAELIVYDQTTAGNRQKIESYLALKYGITLGIPANPVDYIASDSSICWQAHGPYQNSLFGIGRDDGSGLLVTQSNSMNHGSGDGTGKPGQGNIVLRNASSLDNLDFLMIGNTSTPLTPENAQLPPDAVFNGKLRLGEQWQVQHTHNVGTVDLSFDLNGVMISGNPAYITLLISEGDDDFTSGTYRLYNAPVLINNILTYAGITLNHNDYFTFLTNLQSALPVALTDFAANSCGDDICLKWQTTSESNNLYFEVERSTDGQQFIILGMVKGNGNTSTAHRYSYTDSQPLNGKRFYRLKQVDADGSFAYSKTVVFNTGKEYRFNTFITPNPATTTMNLSIEGVQENEPLLFELMDVNGTMVYTKEMTATATVTKITIPRLMVNSGIYCYRITRKENGEMVSGRVVLLQ